MKPVYFLALSLVLLISCDSNSKGVKKTASIKTQVADVNEEMILELSQYYFSNPKSLAHRQQNEIVDYVMAKGLAVKKTDSGLFYVINNKGAGAPLQWGEKIKVHYRGEFLNGEAFDSSYERAEPLEFRVGEMIPAWNEGMKLLSHGDKAILIAPAHLAYGEEGLAPFVGPDKILVFSLEVL